MEAKLEIEAFCTECKSPIYKDQGRYFWEPHTYKCETCGDRNFNPKWEW